MFEIVVACNEKGVIGKNNSIPWDVEEDLEMFKKLTSGHIIIMGRKTYESLPVKPLKNRYNIVLTSEPYNYKSNNENLVFTTQENVENILEKQKEKWGERVFIIGGSDIYKHYFDKCHKLHITVIHKEVEGDTYFPYNLKDITSKHGFKLDKCSYKILSKTDIAMFQFRTYTKM